MDKKPNIKILAEKPKSVAGVERLIDVFVRIEVPENSNTDRDRPKLNLGIALDRSGSMQGEKMREAREAAKYAASQMLPTDVFSTVIFDDHVDVLLTSQPAIDREMFGRAIDRISSRGSTDLHRGWVEAGLQVSEQLDPRAINRVLLITDGQANVGEVNVARIVEQSRNLAARGISTSTIGIGRDFNENLLLPMAEAGSGNSWHVQEPHDMVRIFETEMRGLLTQIGQTATFGIKPASGVSVADVLNDFETDGAGRFKLPNLQAGQKLDIVVRLRVPSLEAGTSIELVKFDLAYMAQDTQVAESVEALFVAGFATSDDVDALPENAELQQAVRLLMNARARREAMDRIDERDFDAADALIGTAVEDTDSLCMRAETPQLRAEMEDLDRLRESLKNDELMARKQMAYRSDSIRKGK